MEKELVIYNCFDDDTHELFKQKRITELKEFARMLGKSNFNIYIESCSNNGTRLRKAIEYCEKNDAYLLTYDLLSLKPNKKAAEALMKELQEEMIFVMFVDDQAVIETLMKNMGSLNGK